MNDMTKDVQDYYGKQLTQSDDLQTNACCTLEPPPTHIKDALANIHEEVQAKYYGCGLTIPTELKDLHVLDLGSGSGRDVYLTAQLVGERGRVIGVDMTPEQLAVANKYIDYHREKFHYKEANCQFLEGNIEKLDELDLQKESFDLIISNCVINLANDKAKVLRDAFSLLKEGGEMYFSDVYASRRVPEPLTKDPVLYGECLSGALYWNDFLHLAKQAGFSDPRLVESKPIEIGNAELAAKCQGIEFYSATYRLFKIQELENDCEEYGQAVAYRGGVTEEPDVFRLDDHHFFEKGKIERVCGNSYLMLQKSRFRDKFDFYGDFSTHYGIFEGCGTSLPFNQNTQQEQSGGSSCC